jgi:hypothetical protein
MVVYSSCLVPDFVLQIPRFTGSYEAWMIGKSEGGWTKQPAPFFMAVLD